jgi:hypothetical protein
LSRRRFVTGEILGDVLSRRHFVEETFCMCTVIIFSTWSQDVNHEDFELSFRYNFLAPPVDNLPVEVQGPYMEEIEEKVRILT